MLDFTGQKVVVTGGAGFLGRAVVEYLRRHRAAVVVPRSRDFDLKCRSECRRLLQEESPDILIHLAAVVGGIGANASNPGRFFYENAIMGLELIEAARRHGLKKFVAAGTICAYPKCTPVPFRESDLWNGYPEETNAPYGLAKKMMLVQLQAYRQQYGFHGIYLLPVNLYGPGDNFDLQSSHVIPAMIRKFCDAVDNGAGRVVLWGSGKVSREFLYVDDCAEAISLAAARYDSAEPVNIGSGREVAICDLAQIIAGLCGFHGEIVWDRNLPDGQPRRSLDTSLARASFGFTARTGLDEGLRRTIAWWREGRGERAGAAEGGGAVDG